MIKTIFITGATSGFGKACAQKFAADKCNLILTGRRLDRLIELKKELEGQYGCDVLPLCFDVQNKTDVFTNINTLTGKWKKIDLLVNNAGLALGRDSFEQAALEDWETMLATNVNGIMYVTKAILPFMIEEKRGHIINIGSIAGKEVYENGNGYCVSKFAADALSKAMRIDLLKYHIKVTAIHPGAAETEFSLVRFKGEQEKAAGVYKGYEPLTAEDVADTVYYCANLPAHVCINDLVITCTSQANSFYINKKI